jgi:protease stability complex PrcB-like protein/antistasin family protein
MPSRSPRSSVSSFPGLVGLVSLALLGCGDVGAPDDVQQVTGDVGAIATTPATAATITFTAFSDDVGAQAGTESRTLIRSARGYQSFFGHAAPAAVDFSREWVMFYAAGTKPTGGYEASFLAVLRAGPSLIAITQLKSPGANCGTTEALTTPYALIKFAAQPGTSPQFFKQDGSSDCGPSLCAAVQCPTGSDCDPATGKCVPGPVRCGGIAGIPCPGLGKCVDDPNDSCDPAAGGADCGGICSCIQNVACIQGTQFDGSASVCACVPVKPPVCPPVCDIYCQYGNVPDANGCPTCQCNPPPTDPCATVKCAGGTHCDAGKCVSDGVSCGGFAGTPCPGMGKCVDNPNDSCDPAAGGADCGGICSCIQNVLCVQGSSFDSSPSVCACVPSSSGSCPPEKCPTPAPATVSMICADGSIAGPVCAPGVNGVCGWTITRCPATATTP